MHRKSTNTGGGLAVEGMIAQEQPAKLDVFDCPNKASAGLRDC